SSLGGSDIHAPIVVFGGTTTGDMTAAGGTPPYSGDGAHTGVSAGPFNFTVTDANGCSTVVSGTISQPPALGASESHDPILCFGGSAARHVTAESGTRAESGDGDKSVDSGLKC